MINYIVQGWARSHFHQMMWFAFPGLISLILFSLLEGKDSYLILLFRKIAHNFKSHKEKMKKELEDEQ